MLFRSLNQPFTIDPRTKRPTPLEGRDESERALIAANVADTQHPAKHYDLSKGRYGVTVTIGKSYRSRLEQGATEIGQILQADPALMPIIGPVYFKFKDSPGAREIADLLRKMRDHQFPWLADQNGDGQAAAQLQQAQAQLQQLQQQLAQAADLLKTDAAKQQATIAKAKIDAATSVALQRMKDATQIAVAQIGAEAKGLQLATEARNEQIALAAEQQFTAGQAAQDRAHEAGLAVQDHQHALDQAQQAHEHALQQAEQQAALGPPEAEAGSEAPAESPAP